MLWLPVVLSSLAVEIRGFKGTVDNKVTADNTEVWKSTVWPHNLVVTKQKFFDCLKGAKYNSRRSYYKNTKAGLPGRWCVLEVFLCFPPF
jgi:hypothetical protein